jgi:hypothetical protein
MLTYDTSALRQTGSRNLMGQKTLPTIWGTYMKLVTKYQISAINSTHWTYMHIFLSNYWWQRSDIWSQASYRYPISWEAFLDPSDSYFLFADFVERYGVPIWSLWPNIRSLPSIVDEKNVTKNVLICSMCIKTNWWQKSDIWSQASYRYPISWEAFFDPSDSYFLFAEERGYHKWALLSFKDISNLL